MNASFVWKIFSQELMNLTSCCQKKVGMLYEWITEVLEVLISLQSLNLLLFLGNVFFHKKIFKD